VYQTVESSQIKKLSTLLQSVTPLSLKPNKPLESHWVAVKRILRYLKGTLHLGLKIIPTNIHHPLSLKAFCDADWASDPDDRRSTSGAALYFGPNLISWWSRKQQVVARSST
jgi:hypothetical protein